MRVDRSYIGKAVRISWKDPCGPVRIELSKARKGADGLARWVEYGVIDDITDGVVRFWSGTASSPGEERPDEALLGWIPEVLIDSVEVLELKS